MASEADQYLRPPPTYLRSVYPGIYEDQEGRTWVTVGVRLSPSQRAQSRDPRVSTVSPAAPGEAVGGLLYDRLTQGWV